MITEAERNDNVFSHQVQPLNIVSFFFKHCLVVSATEPVSNELNNSMSIMLFSPPFIMGTEQSKIAFESF